MSTAAVLASPRQKVQVKVPTPQRSAGLAVFQEAAEARPFVGELLEELAAWGFTEKDVFAVRLAVDEAITNAIHHGNQGDPGKEVFINYEITDVRVLIKVADEGAGFNPDHVADPTVNGNLRKPNGRGLLLMRKYMTWVLYNRRGNCLTMCKLRSRRS